MSREKLLRRMRANPKGVRFAQVEALLRYHGFVVFNQRGSHRTFHHRNGRVLTIVRPHGGKKHCHPDDIRKLLKVLGHDTNKT